MSTIAEDSQELWRMIEQVVNAAKSFTPEGIAARREVLKKFQSLVCPSVVPSKWW